MRVSWIAWGSGLLCLDVAALQPQFHAENALANEFSRKRPRAAPVGFLANTWPPGRIPTVASAGSSCVVQGAYLL